MKHSTLTKIAAMTFATLFAAPTMAQETSTTTSVADTYVRMGNTSDNGAKTSMEIQTSSEKSTDFVGLMKFQFTKPESGYSVKSATLRLVTKRIKGNRTMNVYAFGNDFAESAKYADVESSITAARATDPIATFDLAGQGNKDFEIDAVGTDYRTADKWTNEIDLTTYVQNMTGNTLTIMITKNADENQSSFIFTKEAADFTNEKDADNGAFSVAAADIVPQLVVEYEKNEAMKTNESSSRVDTWIRSDQNAAKNYEKTTMEIKSYTDAEDDTKSRYFYGLLSFDIPAEAINAEKYTIKSASLKLVTERVKGGRAMALYEVGTFPETPKYEDLANDIANLGSAEPVATFDIKGQQNKALGIDAIGDDYRDLSAWTNEIDLTAYVKTLDTNAVNLLIAATENNNNSNCFYASEAEDVTNSKDDTLTFSATDLKPILTIVYESTNDSTAIQQVVVEPTSVKRQGIFTLQGVKVNEMNKPGIYIVNGKKVVKK